jgi:hypothetical protein
MMIKCCAYLIHTILLQRSIENMIDLFECIWGLFIDMMLLCCGHWVFRTWMWPQNVAFQFGCLWELEKAHLIWAIVIEKCLISGLVISWLFVYLLFFSWTAGECSSTSVLHKVVSCRYDLLSTKRGEDSWRIYNVNISRAHVLCFDDLKHLCSLQKKSR